MTEKQKEETKVILPNIETRNIDKLADATGNLYESLVVVTKRANQLSSKQKEELHKKLEEFASSTDNLEEIMENKEQIEISKSYERMPKNTLVALNELVNGEIYFRTPEEIA
jgi:DNA-directed RNA polymerase subunit K/omega